MLTDSNDTTFQQYNTNPTNGLISEFGQFDASEGILPMSTVHNNRYIMTTPHFNANLSTLLTSTTITNSHFLWFNANPLPTQDMLSLLPTYQSNFTQFDAGDGPTIPWTV